MPTRLYHSKSKAGCKRCKARRVKCDEAKPSCSACARHSVSCEYEVWRSSPLAPESSKVRSPKRSHSAAGLRDSNEPTPTRRLRSSASETRQADYDDTVVAAPYPSVGDSPRALELWLMQHFALYTWSTFTTSLVSTWDSVHKHIFFEHEYLLDAVLATSALHCSRVHPSQPMFAAASEHYFAKAIEAHRHEILQFDANNAVALLLTSNLILVHALCSDIKDDATFTQKCDPTSWLRLASQSRHVFRECKRVAGDNDVVLELQQSVAPMMMNNDESFRPVHRKRFEHLLTHGADYETVTPLDREAYECTLSLIGLAYKHAGHELPIATCRRIFSTPARSPLRFIELVEELRPRALAILAHLYAVFKLIKVELWWFEGIAEKQVNRINELLPAGWKAMIEEPLRIVNAPRARK